MVDFVAVDDQIGDWCLCVGTVNGNAKSVVAVSGSIAAVESLLDVMDVVLQQFDVGTRSHNADTQWAEAMNGGAEVTNFEALDSDVTLIVNREDCLSSGRREMGCIKDRRFAGI